MASYANLKAAIQQVIRTNGNQEITGALLQQSLLAMINSLGGYYQFVGIATPETNPGTPDQQVFYIGSAGTYPNFGPAVIPDGNLAVFYYDTNWHYGMVAFPLGDNAVTTPKIANNAITREKLSNELNQSLDELKANIEGGTFELQRDSRQQPATLRSSGVVDSSTYANAVVDKFTGIKPNTKYYITGRIGIASTSCLVCFYDANDNFIASYYPNDGAGVACLDWVVVSPPNAAIMRVNGYLAASSPYPPAAKEYVGDGIVGLSQRLDIEEEKIEDLTQDVSGYITLGEFEIGTINRVPSGGHITDNNTVTDRLRAINEFICQKDGDYILSTNTGYEALIYIVGKIETTTWSSYRFIPMTKGDVFRIAIRNNPSVDYANYTQEQIDSVVIASNVKLQGPGIVPIVDINEKHIKEIPASIATPVDLMINAYIHATNGVEASSSNYKATKYIDISGFSSIIVNTTVLVGAADAGIAFYDKNKTFISGVQWYLDSTDSPVSRAKEMEIVVPNGAVYVRTSMRNNLNDDFYILGYRRNNVQLPTPKIIEIKTPITPQAGFSNRIITEFCTDADEITVKADVDISNNSSVVFLGSVDILGGSHASHVQFDFGAKEMRIYAKGTGNSVPGTIIHTESFSGLGTITKAVLRIGRKERQLWASIEDYKTGGTVEYTVDESALNNYKYPAGWLADKLVYGIISGSVIFERIEGYTKPSPTIVFMGDSITEGYGIPFHDSWAYKAGIQIGNFLVMGRSGGTYETILLQLNGIVDKIRPKYVVVAIGTNGGNTVNNISGIVEKIKSFGCVPILCRVPMKTSGTASINDTIIPQNELTVGFDYATSVNNDLTTQDTTLFQSDKIHPNISGALVMFQRFISDVGNCIF